MSREDVKASLVRINQAACRAEAELRAEQPDWAAVATALEQVLQEATNSSIEACRLDMI